MKKMLLTCALMLLSSSAQAREVWTKDQADQWYGKQKWLVGSNYIPADAINQLEMWQEGSFNPAQIDKELGWAQGLGMTTMRVFLHDALWQQDEGGFKKRMDTFLAISARHGIKPMFVLFDSCWDPNYKLGPQHPPIPGVHNSGWVQSPGAKALADPAQYARLEAFVKGVVGAFAHDDRILGWDVWNEPDNTNGSSYQDTTQARYDQVAFLLPKVFEWARSADPSQPLTSGIWHHDHWENLASLNSVEKTQLTQSDVISFHDYSWPETFEARAKSLETYGRPIICTEYMARGAGSTFDTILPIGKKHNVGMINWGFVNGKTQTDMPWDSWQRPYTLRPPTVWFHDIFRADGTAYRSRESAIIKRLSAAPRTIVPAE
ncbi:MAG: cellulase family glycosylhydrolase [Alphaproteobacteria bacterium]|nr:cellulase family glycosylhydrolase [Alphaproteobacteria bacterium]